MSTTIKAALKGISLAYGVAIVLGSFRMLNASEDSTASGLCRMIVRQSSKYKMASKFSENFLACKLTGFRTWWVRLNNIYIIEVTCPLCSPRQIIHRRTVETFVWNGPKSDATSLPKGPLLQTPSFCLLCPDFKSL